MILKPDDFEIGMYITVLEWSPYEREVYDENLFGSSKGILTITNRDYSYTGTVLQITAINLPFICCKHLSKYKNDIYPSNFDTRRVKFISLNDDYVKAMGLYKEGEIDAH